MKGERNAKEKRSNGIDLCTAGFVECWICCVCGIFERADRAGILFGGAAALVFQLLIFRLLPVF